MEIGTGNSSSSDYSSEPSSDNNDCCEIRQLLLLEKAKSKVWEYFRFPTENSEFSEKDKKNRKKCFVSYALRV